jgi:NADPH:quinone reductase
MDKIPDKMLAIRQDAPGGQLYISEVDVPIPNKGEVLVRMSYSPINPSDLSFLKGTYIQRPHYPLTPGIEGSGTVVASGGGLLPSLRLGKRVCCSSVPGKGGTWAEYMVTSAMKVIPLSKGIDMAQASMLIVNPMTALALIDIAKKGKHPAIVNTAAASVLGQMLVKLCQKYNIGLINLVRKEEQADVLKKLGARHVINTSGTNWESTLRSLSNKLNATLLLDAVAGEMTTRLTEAAPNGSTIMVYANLSGNDFAVNPRTLLQGDKTITNFYLGNWASKQPLLKTLATARKAQKLLSAELKSEIRMIYKLEQVNEAIADYTGEMTGGKVLLKLQ